MRVKIAGFKPHFAYTISYEEDTHWDVYFSNKNYVLIQKPDIGEDYKILKLSKRKFKNLLSKRNVRYAIEPLLVNNFFNIYSENEPENELDCYWDGDLYIEDGWVCTEPWDI